MYEISMETVYETEISHNTGHVGTEMKIVFIHTLQIDGEWCELRVVIATLALPEPSLVGLVD